MTVKVDEDTVCFVLLEETGPQDVLLFSCKRCPDSKLTSHQLESHTIQIHHSRKLTVGSVPEPRTRSRKTSTS